MKKETVKFNITAFGMFTFPKPVIVPSLASCSLSKPVIVHLLASCSLCNTYSPSEPFPNHRTDHNFINVTPVFICVSSALHPKVNFPTLIILYQLRSWRKEWRGVEYLF